MSEMGLESKSLDGTETTFDMMGRRGSFIFDDDSSRSSDSNPLKYLKQRNKSARSTMDGSVITLSPLALNASSTDASTDIAEDAQIVGPCSTETEEHAAAPNRRPRSILLHSSSTLDLEAINENGRWRRLPRPNMQKLSCSTTDHDTPSSSRKTEEKQVSFGNLGMRLYSQTLSDNPSVSYGPPIQLDWEYTEQADITVDEYEDLISDRIHIKNRRHLSLSYYRRFEILQLRYGLPEEEIMAAKRAVKKFKRQRFWTRFFIPIMPLEDCISSAVRKTKRALQSKENLAK